MEWGGEACDAAVHGVAATVTQPVGFLRWHDLLEIYSSVLHCY